MDSQFRSMMQTLQYIIWMRPVFRTDALFSDETENYVSPMEPKCGETVTIRFRTWKDNVDRVYFISGALKKEMQLTESEETFDRSGLFYSEVGEGRGHVPDIYRPLF